MKTITLISDTHAKHNQLNGDLPGGDILIHAGDFMTSGYSQTEAIQFFRWFDAIDTYETKIFIAGNHDRVMQNEPETMRGILTGYKTIDYLEDDSCVLYEDGHNGDEPENNIRIYGSPHQPEFFSWAFNLPRNGDELKQKWAAIPENTHILVTHGPSWGYNDTVQGRRGTHLGCELLRERIDVIRPKIHVCGHIHSGHGYYYEYMYRSFNTDALKWWVCPSNNASRIVQRLRDGILDQEDKIRILRTGDKSQEDIGQRRAEHRIHRGRRPRHGSARLVHRNKQRVRDEMVRPVGKPERPDAGDGGKAAADIHERNSLLRKGKAYHNVHRELLSRNGIGNDDQKRAFLFRAVQDGPYRANMFLGVLGGAHIAPSRNSTGNNRYFGLNAGDTVFTPMANGNNSLSIFNMGGLISVWENGTQTVSSMQNVAIEGMSITANLFDRWDTSGPLTVGTSISEVIFYNSDQRSSRAAIESSASAYFNAAYSTDSDATAFLSATGITSSTISTAINVMVKSLKSEGLWTKMKAIYPFVGGNATAHRFNLKDPRDLDAAFRLTPYGGITHDANGAAFNGSNGWYDTNMNAAANLSNNSMHLSFYSMTNNNNQYSGGEMGHVGYNSWTSPPQDYTKQLLLKVRNSQYAGSNAAFGSGNLWTSYSTTDGYGLTIGSITSATSSSIAKGYSTQYFSSKSSATGANTGSLPAFNISIGKTQGYGEWSQNQCAFSSIGDGLSYDESAKLYGIVQIFQISIGRRV